MRTLFDSTPHLPCRRPLRHGLPDPHHRSARRGAVGTWAPWLLATTLWLAACAPAAAAPPAGESAPCQERVEPGAAQPERLPTLHYDCLRLAGGQAVLVGRAGRPGAPLVLLVHGLGQNAHRDWAPALSELAPRFQVATVDLPGFGASPAPGQAYEFEALGRLLASLVDRLAPGQRVHVVGHSLGAALSLAFAHRHADRVDRLVLVDAAGILLKPVFVQALARQRAPRLGVPPLDQLLRFVEARVHDLSSLLLLGRDDRYDFLPWLVRNPDVRQALLGNSAQVDAAIGLVEHDFSAAIRELRTPTSLIWGADDRIAPLRTGQLLAARLQQAELHVIDDAGHTPMFDRPATFNRLLLAALIGPVPQRVDDEAPGPSQGDVVCRNESDLRYSGRFDSLTLERCGSVSIERAQIGRLVVNASTVSLSHSTITSDDVALLARDSEVSATAVRISGRVAIRADNSWFDLAGVSLQAREQAVDLLPGRGSRLFFSVSDWQDRDYRGDAHFIWPRPAAQK
jgi:pimeloyl-ACP methyl ester carboxylesterase